MNGITSVIKGIAMIVGAIFLALARLATVGLGLAGVVIGVLFLFFAGKEALYLVKDRPGDVAAMAAKANLDLSGGANSLVGLQHDLGPPTSTKDSGAYTNAGDYDWFKDNAIQVEAVGDMPTRIVIGDRSIWRLVGNPAFRGSFLGLRLGMPPPSPAQAAALRASARTCCHARTLDWGVSGGRITWIEFDRVTAELPVSK